MSLRSKYRNFRKDKLGNVAIIAALSAPVIVVASGAAVDVVRFQEARQVAQRALDGASLAAATEISRGLTSEDEAEERAFSIFAANVDLGDSNSAGDLGDADGISGSDEQNANSGAGGSSEGNGITGFDFDYDIPSASVTTSVNLSIPTIFGSVYGIDSLSTELSSTAAFSGAPGARNNVEFSFVLDVTGSMRGDRLASLKEALGDSLNVLLPSSGINDDRVRIGFVPYATSVNLGEHHLPAVGSNSSSASSVNACASEREGVNSFADIAPESASAATLYETDSILRNINFGSTVRYVRNGRNRSISNVNPCPTVAIRPLTNNRADLLADIQNLNANGGTGGHMGIDWGINLLSENWQDFWPEGSKPSDYNDEDARKVLVVMTDGAFNASFFDATKGNDFLSAASGQDAVSNNSAIELCNVAKDESRNIEVYTIAFQAGSSARTLLRNCATPDDPDATDVTVRGPHFFDASSGNDLAAAFRNIVAQELQVLLTN